MSDRTEEPTAKRLKRARDEGDSGASAFASQSIGLLAALAVAPAAIASTAAWCSIALTRSIAKAADSSVVATVDAAEIASAVLGHVVPLLAVVAIAAAVATLVQTGGAIATSRIAIKLDRLNVLRGLAGLLSPARAFAVVRALLGAAVAAFLVVSALRGHAADLARLAGRVDGAGGVAGHLVRAIVRSAALAGLAIAVVDVVVTRIGWRKRLRMTKEEVKREHKESEGDPQTKAARERAHHEMLASVAVANVKNATVVVVNPTHLACALRYGDADGDDASGGSEAAAPTVVASGEGELAERIVRAARDYGVPVVRDVPLARALRELEIGAEIPEALYEAVAEVLVAIAEEEGR